MLTVLALMSAQAEPAAVREVAVSRPAVLLGDVADLSRLPVSLKGQAARLQVAAFKPGQTQMRFTTGRLAQRARTLIPALGPWLSGNDAETVLVRFTAPVRPDDATQPACMKLASPLAAGAVATAHDLKPATCGETPMTALRYDVRAKAVRATRNLQPGDTVAAPPAFALAAVRPGETLYAQTRIGPVVVQREVRALQAARPGQRLFVSTPDGAVLTASVAEAAR